MRLLFCRECADIKALNLNRRFCACKLSFGQITLEDKVRYGGPASILGLPREVVEILRGPASEDPSYVLPKLIVVAPVVGRKPAKTLEFVG